MGTESSDTGFERQPQGVIGRSRRRLKGPLWLQVLFRCFLAPLLLPSQVVAGIQQDTVDPGRKRRLAFETAQAAGNHTNRRRDASATKRLTSTEARAQSRFSCETGCSHAR